MLDNLQCSPDKLCAGRSASGHWVGRGQLQPLSGLGRSPGGRKWLPGGGVCTPRNWFLQLCHFFVQIKSGIWNWVYIIFFCSDQAWLGCSVISFLVVVQIKLDSPEDLEHQDQVALGAAAAAGPGCHALRCGATGLTCILYNIFTNGIKSISQFKKIQGFWWINMSNSIVFLMSNNTHKHLPCSCLHQPPKAGA